MELSAVDAFRNKLYDSDLPLPNFDNCLGSYVDTTHDFPNQETTNLVVNVEGTELKIKVSVVESDLFATIDVTPLKLLRGHFLFSVVKEIGGFKSSIV